MVFLGRFARILAILVAALSLCISVFAIENKKPKRTLPGMGPCEKPLLPKEQRFYEFLRRISRDSNKRITITIDGDKHDVDLLQFTREDITYAGPARTEDGRVTNTIVRRKFEEIEDIRREARRRKRITLEEFEQDKTTPTTAVQSLTDIPVIQAIEGPEPGKTRSELIQIYRELGFSLSQPIKFDRPKLLTDQPKAYLDSQHNGPFEYLDEGGMHTVYRKRGGQTLYKVFKIEALLPLAKNLGVSIAEISQLIPELEIRQKVLAELLRRNGFVVAPFIADHDQIAAGYSQSNMIHGSSLKGFCKTHNCREWKELMDFETRYRRAINQQEVLDFFVERNAKVFPGHSIVLAQGGRAKSHGEGTPVGIDKKYSDIKLRRVLNRKSVSEDQRANVLRYTHKNGREEFYLLIFLEG